MTPSQHIGELDGLFAVVATGGTTNAGTVDDLEGVRWVTRRRDLWFHVDGAYTRDRDDDYLFELAIASGAMAIVTGDKDLRAVVDPPIPVLTPRAFLESRPGGS